MKKTAQELGVSLKSIQKPYVKYLAASKDSLQDTRKVARSFIALGTALNATPTDMGRVIRAIEQMQSKGQIMAEELKLQLGDTMPGALKLFSKAMGVTTAEFIKLMETGNVSADLLKKVADVINKDYADAIRLGSQSTRAQLNRLSTGFFLLRASVGRASEAVFGINSKLGRLGNWMTNTADDLDNLNSSGKKTLFWFGAFLAALGPGTLIILAIRKAFLVWGQALLFLFSPLGKILKFLGLLAAPFVTNGIMGIALAFGKMLPLLVKLRGALFLIGRFFLANPLGLFITATYLIIQNWQKIVDLFDKAVQKAKQFFGIGKKKVDQEVNSKVNLRKTLNPELASSALSKFGVPQQTNIPQQSTMNSNNTINQNLSFAPGTSSKDKEAIKGAITEANQDLMTNMLFEARLQE
jgi:tape measure domain-containing protein